MQYSKVYTGGDGGHIWDKGITATYIDENLE